MEKVRGRMRRIRHRLELPSCWKPKKDMPNLIYTVLDRDCDSLLCQSCHASAENRLGAFLSRANSRRGRDRRLSDVSFWDKEDASCEEGGDCWNVLHNVREGPTIRIATFDVALFSLAPAIPPDHPCAGAAQDRHDFEDLTPLHFMASESSSIFSDKSKSTSSDGSSALTSFSNSRESTDSIEACAILSQYTQKPTQSFSVVSHPPSSSPIFDISRVWKSRSSKAKPTSKSKTSSPFHPGSLKNNVTGNFYHSKLNPVFGLSSSSSKCLMDSLPCLFSDVLSSNLGVDSSNLPSHFSHEGNGYTLESSPHISEIELPCESGFQTPVHSELLPPSGAVSPSTFSQAELSNVASPLNNSVSQFDSPCSNLSSFAPSIFNGSAEVLPPPPSTTAPSILDILLEVDADIISLQEVRAEEERDMKPLSELAEALGMEYAYAESWAPEFGNAVLSRWPIKSASVQQLHDETDCRNVLKVIVEVPLVGDLHIYCTKLDHLDEDWRMKQVHSFLQMAPASQPHILTGNLNSLERSDYSADRWEEIAQARKQNRKLPPRADVMKKLVQEKGYMDAKRVTRESKCNAELQLKGQGVDGTCQHGTRLDYILGSSKLPFDFVPGSYAVIPSRGTSNHNLALVDLQPRC